MSGIILMPLKPHFLWKTDQFFDLMNKKVIAQFIYSPHFSGSFLHPLDSCGNVYSSVVALTFFNYASRYLHIIRGFLLKYWLIFL